MSSAPAYPGLPGKISLTTQQLELERTQLLGQVGELRAANARLASELKVLQNKLCSPSVEDVEAAKAAMARVAQRSLPPGPDERPPTLEAIVIVTLSRLQRENNLLNDRNEQLQARLISLMDEKVALLTRIEEEEHITVQLQRETETIGEYIAIYQEQRQTFAAQLAHLQARLGAVERENAALRAGSGALPATLPPQSAPQPPRPPAPHVAPRAQAAPPLAWFEQAPGGRQGRLVVV